MNIKLHTPKSLKAGSGMSSMKQFLLSLLATTVSIALTFGTAAIVDNNKKQKEKREIVMMVMYDMYNSLNSLAVADSSLHQLMDYQRQIAEDTTLFRTLKFQMVKMLPRTDYTETTERIFSSNIESINTVGNVLFCETVSEFYMNRKQYKTEICDSIFSELKREMPYETLKGTLDFDFFFHTILSGTILNDMHQKYVQCQQMMEVTDEQLELYHKKREDMKKSTTDVNHVQDSLFQELRKIETRKEDAKKKLKLE